MSLKNIFLKKLFKYYSKFRSTLICKVDPSKLEIHPSSFYLCFISIFLYSGRIHLHSCHLFLLRAHGFSSMWFSPLGMLFFLHLLAYTWIISLSVKLKQCLLLDFLAFPMPYCFPKLYHSAFPSFSSPTYVNFVCSTSLVVLGNLAS